MATINMHPAMKHILEVVFALPANSPLHRAMESNMYISPEDLMMESNETIDDLTFKGDDKKLAKIPKGGAGLIKTLKQYVAHQQNQGIPFDPNDWVSITKEQFDKFRILNSNNAVPIVATSTSQPSIPTSQPSHDLVRDFKRGIK